MKEMVRNTMGRTAVIFSILYFFTPFGGWLNNIYQSILPEHFRTTNSGDLQIITGDILFTGEKVQSGITGVNISILTGELLLSGENETGSIKIPENPRDYLNYLLENGTAGVDYIIAELPKQPFVYSSDKADNNKLKAYYIARTKSVFTLPQTEKTGYVLFQTNAEISDNRDLFVGINGGTKGAIRKDKSLPVAEYGEYLYRMDKVILAGKNGKGLNLYDYVKDNQLWLNAFAGEKNRYIQKIIIFFK